jgi:hypothetical protein
MAWHWCSVDARRKALSFESHQIQGNNLLKPIYKKEMLANLSSKDFSRATKEFGLIAKLET